MANHFLGGCSIGHLVGFTTEHFWGSRYRDDIIFGLSQLPLKRKDQRGNIGKFSGNGLDGNAGVLVVVMALPMRVRVAG